MFTTNDMLTLSSFMKRVREKGQFIFFDYSEVFEKHRLIVEFDIDSYEMMSKLVEDWIVFHSKMIDSYYLETNNDCVQYKIYLKEQK